jgi:spore coat protein A
MHARLVVSSLVSICLTLVAGSAAAIVVTVAPSQDTSIFSEDGSLSNGAGDHLFAGRTKGTDGTDLRRGLLAFDVAGSVPAGSTINSVTLTLFVSRERTGDETVSLHRVQAAWGEGTSHAAEEEGRGATATTNDATWTHRLWPGTTWTSNGGDFVAGASASATVGNQNNYFSWSSAGMAADVQSWLITPAGNFGWILIGNEVGTRVVKRFDSRENTIASQRPELEIDFAPPAAATGACCATDGSCGIVLDENADTTCTAPSSYQGSGTTCSPNLCPQPTGACCIADASGTCNEVTAADCASAGGTFQGELTTCTVNLCPVIPTPFVDALPLPGAATPVSGSSGGVATYDIAMREVQQQLHSELANPTTVWGYGDGPTGASYPGPTIEATSDQTVTVNWINDLRDTSHGCMCNPLRTSHYLPIDTCPHGPVDQSPSTVVHVHGAHVDEDSDGYPEDTYLPGNQATFTYPNKQLASTLWYHDHALGITRLNVYMGLAGFFLLRDAVENALNLPSGQYEIPLAIQDRSFNQDGSFKYPPVWQDTFFGETMLVNGKVWPFHDVDRGKYRLRLLNGCNSRVLTLQFCPGSNTSPCPTPATFQVLGQEGGLLPAPVPLTEVTMGPGERTDVVVDFQPYSAGTEVYLVNSAPAPFPGDPGDGVVPDVMKFVVQSAAGDQDPLPAALRPLEQLDEADSVKQREFELLKGPGNECSPFIWEIVSTDGLNGPVLGSLWDDITEDPRLLDTEVWRFINRSGMTHPMHMHLVMFQVLDRQTFDDSGGTIVPTGPLVPPAAYEAGWKDTVQVAPGEMVRVIARFEDYEGLYAYHCHILEHEDHEMMRQFLVPEPSATAMLLAGGGLVALLARRRRAGPRR